MGIKSSKGTVVVESFRDRLRLRWRYRGQRKSLALGLPDTKNNRKVAQIKANQIELDIISGNYDRTLLKYKDNALDDTQETIPKISLIDLFRQYKEYRSRILEASTILRDYAKIENRLEKLPESLQALENAIAIQQHLLKHYSPETTRRTIQQLKACCRWSVENGLLETNPFNKLTLIPKTRTKDRSRKPFTSEERQAILESFANSPYLNYVKFLFLTGCRPEEAIAIKKRHVFKGYLLISEAYASDVRIKKGTKTNRVRKFPINNQLREFLDGLELNGLDNGDLLFPSPKSKLEIDPHNFLNRHWKPRLLRLLDRGLVREYLPTYHTRHTFISLALEAGIPDIQVAEWVGTSVKTISSNYAGVTRAFTVPEF